MASASVTVEPSSTVKRFPEVSDSDFEQILKEKDSLNTQRATQSAVRIFRTYLMEKQLPVEFESFDTHRLDKILSKFWTEARTEKGELYKKSSLFSLRHGINRHLQLKDASTDLINGKEFRESQLIFKAMTKELKRQGKGGITHHPPIDDADLLKLYKSFDVSGNNPQSLQEKVFVDVMLYFGRRGRENLRDLKMSDFSCATDGEGAVYIYMDTDELTKNHQLDPNTAKGRMYQIKAPVGIGVLIAGTVFLVVGISVYCSWKRRISRGKMAPGDKNMKNQENFYADPDALGLPETIKKLTLPKTPSEKARRRAEPEDPGEARYSVLRLPEDARPGIHGSRDSSSNPDYLHAVSPPVENGETQHNINGTKTKQLTIDIPDTTADDEYPVANNERLQPGASADDPYVTPVPSPLPPKRDSPSDNYDNNPLGTQNQSFGGKSNEGFRNSGAFSFPPAPPPPLSFGPSENRKSDNFPLPPPPISVIAVAEGSAEAEELPLPPPPPPICSEDAVFVASAIPQ